MDAAGKTVVITGGGSGIGLALARVFLEADARVVICGRTLSKLEQAQQENPGLAIAACDVTDASQIKDLRERCDREFGGADVVVNNAGVFHVFDVVADGVSLETQLHEVDVDFNGPIRMVDAFLPGMLEKPEAALVNVSSGLAFVPYTPAPIYCATKAAMHSWTRSLRKQLAGTGVRVFELMPPVVDTGMVDELDFPKMSPEKLAGGFMKGFERDSLEMVPGQSRQLRLMSRLAPKFIFKMLNR